MISWNSIPWERIDQVQDLLSIPFAIFVCIILWIIWRKLKDEEPKATYF